MPPVEVFLTQEKGWGVRAAAPISKGAFVVEYAGGARSRGAALNAPVRLWPWRRRGACAARQRSPGLSLPPA